MFNLHSSQKGIYVNLVYLPVVQWRKSTKSLTLDMLQPLEAVEAKGSAAKLLSKLDY